MPKPKFVKPKTQFRDVMAILQKLGYDPIYALVKVANDECEEAHIRLKAHLALLNKTYPDLKNIDHTIEMQADKDIEELKKEVAITEKMYKKDY